MGAVPPPSVLRQMAREIEPPPSPRPSLRQRIWRLRSRWAAWRRTRTPAQGESPKATSGRRTLV